ncbi:MAG: hydroxymethylbilane synthase, partial [Clostridia bacterium]|nr:hydroxymethylbilane synthase [Clostridia bacterium]
MRTIIVGSRESPLAVVQSRLVAEQIERTGGTVKAELRTMKTTGDRILDRSLDEVGGKGLFVKELDLALREKRTDLSVQSLKDVPMDVDPSLPLVAFSRRED